MGTEYGWGNAPMVKRALLVVAAVMTLMVAAVPSAFAVRIDQNCTASIQNQMVRVNPNGTFAIPNVPVAPGLYRIRVVCKNPDGTTYTLASPFTALVSNGITTISQLSPGSFSPIPVSVEVLAPFGNTGLTTNGQTMQLTVRGLLPDGSFADLTQRTSGTTYTSSNARIASVGLNGLVTAVSHGRAIITVRNEGVTGSIILHVLSPQDTDGDGTPDDWETVNGLNPSDPSDAGRDLDGDGLTNLEEFRAGTNPRVADTDGDGLSDGDEVSRGTNPLNPDSDSDGLLDGQEVRLGTNPQNPDSDNDGVVDGTEVQIGLNPLVTDQTTTVQGRILDNNGSPLAGASATAFRFFVGTTDATGLFTITNVPATLGNIVVSAQFIRPGQVLDGSSAPTPPVANGTTDVGTFQLIVDSGAVTGLITNLAGQPVPGALVNVLSATTLRTATADSGGIYRVSNSVAGPLVVTAADPRTGLRGRATGVLLANQSATVNVQLGPSAAITGSVFQRDGHTPVGTGVIVRLSGAASQQVQTDGFGRYLFDYVPLGSYTVEASDSDGNRGRTTIAVLTTGQVVTVDVTFLGRGTVAGRVLDGAGNPVANARVTLGSQSIFGGSQSTTSDGNGGFQFTKVFIGDFSLSAQDSIGRRAGNSAGHIDSENQEITGADITLTSVGSVAGTVRKVDGTTTVSGARVTLSNGLVTTTDGSGRYTIDLVPVGSYVIDVTDQNNGDRGRKSVSIAAQDAVANGDVNLNGQGAVTVTVRDGGGNLVSGASVTLYSQTQFGGSQNGVTGNDGTAPFARVLAGGFSVYATNPATGLSGSENGSVTANSSTDITVNLQGAGSFVGTVFNPDGTTPAPGVSVRLNGQVSRSVRSNTDGTFRFDGIPTGAYILGAYDGFGNLRAQGNGTIASNGDSTTVNLTLIGVGTVTGTVRYPDGSIASSLGVTLISSLPGYGRSFTTSTNVNGVYNIPQVPVGPFSANSSRQTSTAWYYGSTSGQISNNGQTVTADINLSESLIPLNFGVNLYDGNGYPYDIKGDGSINSGHNNLFVGAGNNRGGMLLSVERDGGTTGFGEQSMGTTSHGGRQVEITQQDLAGLKITRKIMVPGGGYFARYLEIIDNPGASPITFNLKVAGNIRQLNGFPRILATSSGDTNLDVSDPGTRDKWLVTDDGIDDDPFTAGGIPTTAFLLDGPNGTERVASGSFTLPGAGLLEYQWDSITVAPGESIAYMHFVAQQTNGNAGIASAQRLEQLPPEAITTYPDVATQFTSVTNGLNLLCNAIQSSTTVNFYLSQCQVAMANATNTNTTVQALLTGNSQDRNALQSAVMDTRTQTENIRSFVNSLPSFQPPPDFTVDAVARLLRTTLSTMQDDANDYLDLLKVRNFNFPINAASSLDVLPPLNGRVQGRVISNDRITGIPNTQIRFRSSHPLYAHYFFMHSDSTGAFAFAPRLNNSSNSLPIPYAGFTLLGTHPQFGTDSPLVTGAIDVSNGVGQADIVFTNAGTLRGLVRRSTGDVVSSGQVIVSGAALINGQVPTNVGPDGSYAFFAMPEGQVTLIAQLPHPQGTALVGSTIANVLANQTTVQDILLQPTGTVTGSVRRENGNPVVNLPVVLHAPNFSRTTNTDTGGNFTLVDVPVGAFLLDTFDPSTNTADSASLNVSANTTTTQNLLLRLGGTVTGVVRNGSVPISAVQVVMTAANGTSATTTDGTGVYRFDHVPPGNVSVVATDPASQLHGNGSGALGLSGQTLQIDMTLFAAGNVSGTVFRADGTTPVANAVVTLTRGYYYNTFNTTTDASGHYSLSLIPIGSFTLDAVDNATGDRGRTQNQVSSNNENRLVNIQMLGFGSVEVTVRDAGNLTVNNALVTLNSQSTFGGSQSTHTNVNGIATFSKVFTGNFTVYATDEGTGLGGNTSGSVPVNGSTSVTIHLAPAGSVTGRVLAPNGTTAVAGARVRLSGPVYRETDSAADGSFRFDAAPLGTYSMDVVDANGRIRDRQTDIRLLSHGDVVVRNLVYAGQGTVTGHVLNPDSTPAAGVAVTVRSLNAILGGFFNTTTDADGLYNVNNVPVGRFTAVGNPGGQTSGETSGQITADGQTVTADIQLQNNSVSLPRTLYDGNNFYFDIQGDARIYSGHGGVWAGDYNTYNGASVLDLTVNGGASTRFPSASVGYTEENGREIAITQQNIGGLDVTRKVFVPQDGYFARYLEVLRNPTGADISLNVRVTNNLYCYSYYYYYCSNLYRTSSGDNQFSISGNNPDRWIVTEDSYAGDPFIVGGFPATAFAFDSADAALHPSQVGYGSNNVTYYYYPRYAWYQWDNLVVPAGQTIALMHFDVQQPSTDAAIASVQRLAQLPPEALTGLSAEEIAGIRNFAVPADGISTLPALPAVLGSVAGRVLASDDSIVPSATVQVKSNNLLYSRTWQVSSDSSGVYQVNSVLGNGNSIILPVDGFTAFALHPNTNVQSPVFNGNFPAGQNAVTQDIKFSNTGVLSGFVRYGSGANATGGQLQVQIPGRTVSVTIAPDGSYYVAGLPAGTFAVTAFVPSSGGGTLRGTLSAIIAAGQTTTANVVLPAIGSLTGTITDGAGNPVPSIWVYINTSGYSGNLLTDGAGVYLFSQIPVGTYTVKVYEPNTGVETQANATILADTTSTVNLQLVALGTVNVTVTFASGSPAANAPVYMRHSRLNNYSYFKGYTGSDGGLTIANVPVGTFTLSANHPSNSNVSGSVNGSLSAQGEVVNTQISLPPTGVISGTVTRPHGESLSGAYVRAYDNSRSYGAVYTDSAGAFTLTQIPGNRSITLEVRHTVDSSVQHHATVQIDTDGQTLIHNVVMPALATVRVTALQADDVTPASGIYIYIQDSVRTYWRSVGTTNASGQLDIANVPEGEFQIQNANIGVGSTTVGMVTAADDLGVVNITIHPPLQGNIQGTVFAGDGSTPVPYGYVQLFDVASGDQINSTYTDGNGFYSFTNIAAGENGFRVTAHASNNSSIVVSQTGTFSSAGQTVNIDLVLPISVITGTVRYNDGTPVQYPNVFVTLISQYGYADSYYADSFQDGTYRLVAVPLGPFTIYAQDNSSGLTASVDSTVSDVSTPITGLDITLPRSVRITGRLLNSNSAAVNGYVSLTSTAATYTQYAYFDSQGNYEFAIVGEGAFVLQGRDYNTGFYVTHTGAIGPSDGDLVIDLTLPAQGTVNGTVFQSDGSTPIADAYVRLHDLTNTGSEGWYQTYAYTDSNGMYSVNFPLAKVLAEAEANNTAGRATGTLDSPSTPLTLNITTGNAVALRHNLDGIDGFRYDVQCDGSLSDGGTTDRSQNDAYDGAYELSLDNNWYFDCFDTAGLEANGRQLAAGPHRLGLLDASRKIFVPDAGGFARFLNIFTNPTDAPVTTNVTVESNLGSDSSTHIVVAPADTNNTYAVTTQSDYCCDPALGHVLAGAGTVAGTIQPRNVYFSELDDNTHVEYRVTVPAHGTVIVMQFAVQRNWDDPSAATAQAEALANLADPAALDGMTETEKSQVVNFTIASSGGALRRKGVVNASISKPEVPRRKESLLKRWLGIN